MLFVLLSYSNPGLESIENCELFMNNPEIAFCSIQPTIIKENIYD